MNTSIAQFNTFRSQSLRDPIEQGDVQWSFIYQKLRSIAAYLMHSERKGHTLSIEGLVHEAYLRLFSGPRHVQNKEHLFRLFTRAMKRTLIDYARNRNTLKREGHKFQSSLDDALQVPATDPFDEEEEVSDALERLAQTDERLGQVIELRFFHQLSIEDMAGKLQVSTRTVDRDLRRAKLLLFHALTSDLSPDSREASA